MNSTRSRRIHRSAGARGGGIATEADDVATGGAELAESDVPMSGPAGRTTALVLLIAGLVGFAAAFVLAVEKFLLLTNPFYTPSCSVSAAVSCTSVMQSWQSAVFGFPNPLLGIAGFAVVAATGAMLLAGGRLASWYRIGLQVGVTAGLAFVGWLIGQSLFVIQALCPYCMIVWVATLTAFWYLTLDNLDQARHRLPATAVRTLDGARRTHSALLLVALLAVTGLVVIAALSF